MENMIAKTIAIVSVTHDIIDKDAQGLTLTCLLVLLCLFVFVCKRYNITTNTYVVTIVGLTSPVIIALLLVHSLM